MAPSLVPQCLIDILKICLPFLNSRSIGNGYIFVAKAVCHSQVSLHWLRLWSESQLRMIYLWLHKNFLPMLSSPLCPLHVLTSCQPPWHFPSFTPFHTHTHTQYFSPLQHPCFSDTDPWLCCLYLLVQFSTLSVLRGRNLLLAGSQAVDCAVWSWRFRVGLTCLWSVSW